MEGHETAVVNETLEDGRRLLSEAIKKAIASEEKVKTYLPPPMDKEKQQKWLKGELKEIPDEEGFFLFEQEIDRKTW